MKTIVYTFKPWHIILTIWLIITIYCFTTNYECGYRGVCENGSSTWIGAYRFVVSVFVGAILFMWFILGGYEKSFKISIPFTKDDDMNPDHPYWEDFQDFLKER